MPVKMDLKQWGVGQGGFHTETITANDGDQELAFRFIYDCGTASKRKPLKLAIEAYVESLPYGAVVDALYISHWDDDHCNGIEYLRRFFKNKEITLKELIAPPRPDLRIRALFRSGASSSWEKLIEDPAAVVADWFQGCKVVYARDYFEEEVGDDRETSRRTETITVRTTHGGAGRQVMSTVGDVMWELVPFVQPAAVASWAAADEKLPSVVTTYGELTNAYQAARSALKAASVNGLPKSVNSASLMLYSGSPREVHGAWLGTGDANLSDAPEHENMMKEFVRAYGSRFHNLSFVNTPHHGADTSSGYDFWTTFGHHLCAVSNASGTKHGKGVGDYHPHAKVVKDILFAFHCHHVTRTKSDTLTNEKPHQRLTLLDVVGGRK